MTDIQRKLHNIIKEIIDSEIGADDEQCAFRDLLTDMRHVADQSGISFALANEGAFEVYCIERNTAEDENPEGVEAVCETCGKPCEYNSEVCLCKECENA